MESHWVYKPNLKTAPYPTADGQHNNKKQTQWYFGGFLSPSDLSGNFVIFFTLQMFSLWIMISNVVFLWHFCKCKYWVFAFALFLCFCFGFSALFICLFCTVIIFSFVSFPFPFFVTCWFSSEKERTSVSLGDWGNEEDLGRVGRREP